jgi:Ca2+-binding EF-hand superfamily protein
MQAKRAGVGNEKNGVCPCFPSLFSGPRSCFRLRHESCNVAAVRAALLVLFLGAMSARADNDMMMFRALDLDGDGYVSLAEAAGNEDVVSRFDRADRNRDGKLSPREFANLKNIKVRVAKKKEKTTVRTLARAKKQRPAEETAAAETAAAAGGTRPPRAAP